MLLSIVTLFSALLGTSFIGHATAFQHENRALASIPNDDACLCQVTELVVVIGTAPPVASLPSPTATPKPSVDDVEYMTPCPNPTVDKTAPENMVPARSIAVYYESSDSSSVAIVTCKNMRSPVVVLEYISHINTYACTGSTLVITFTDLSSLQYASSSWQAALSSQTLVILSYCPSCGQDYPYQRSWLKIQTIVIDETALTISCTYTVVEMTDVVTIVDIAFGPPNEGSFSSTTSSFSTVIGSTSALRTGTPSVSTSSSSTISLFSTIVGSISAPKKAISSVPTSSPGMTSSFSTATGSTSASNTATGVKYSGGFLISPTASTKSSSVSTLPSSATSSVSSIIGSTSSPSQTSTGSIPTDTVAPLQSPLDFDVALDDSLGYLDPTSPTFWSQLMPGVDSSSFSARKLRQRAFSFGSIASSLTNAAKNAITNDPQAAINAVTDFIQNAQNNGFSSAVADAVTSTAQALANYLSSFTLGPFPFNFFPGKQTTTPFGDGVQLTSASGSAGIVTGTIEAYCIGCGVSGSVTIAGQFTIDVQQEALTTATIEISGPLQAQLAFALIGKVAATNSFQTNVFTYPIPPGLSILKLITIGPYISVDVGGSFDFSLQGGVELGGTLSWSNLDAHVDLLAQSITPSGYYPTFAPIFDFEESASLGATLYGLVTVGAGIKILGGKYAADVGIVGKPEVDLQANQQLYSQYELSQLPDGDVICGGVSIGVQQVDSAYVEVEYIVANKTKSTTWGLATATPYTFSTCFGQLSTINQASTSAAPSSSNGASSAPPAQSSCYYLDSDEPDDDGDEETTCVPISTDSNSTPPPSSQSSSTTSSASISTTTCDPTLDDFAFVSCISSLYAAQQTAEASIFGGVVPPVPVGKRGIAARQLLAATPASQFVRHVPRQTGSPAVLTSAGIASLDGSIFVSWADDGNLVVDQDSTRSSFQAIGGVVFADSHSRFLHLYEDTVTALGVSRLRLASLDAMPTPSVLVALVPLKLADGSFSYVATTTDGQLFYLLTCLIDEQYPKVFLAKDPTAGAIQLEDATLATTLTGGNVTECGFAAYGPGS